MVWVFKQVVFLNSCVLGSLCGPSIVNSEEIAGVSYFLCFRCVGDLHLTGRLPVLAIIVMVVTVIHPCHVLFQRVSGRKRLHDSAGGQHLCQD